MTKNNRKEKVKSNLTSMQAVTYSKEFQRADRAGNYKSNSMR